MTKSQQFMNDPRGSPLNSIQDVYTAVKPVIQRISSAITSCIRAMGIARTYDAIVAVLRTFVVDVLHLIDIDLDADAAERTERRLIFIRTMAPIEGALSFVTYCIGRFAAFMSSISVSIDNVLGTDMGSASRVIEMQSGLIFREVYSRLKGAGVNDRFCKAYMILLAAWMPYAMLFYMRDPITPTYRQNDDPRTRAWWHILYPWRWRLHFFPHHERNYPFKPGTDPGKQRYTEPDGGATFLDWNPRWDKYGQTRLELIIYAQLDTLIRSYTTAKDSQIQQMFVLAQTSSVLFMKVMLGMFYAGFSVSAPLPAIISTLNFMLVIFVVCATLFYTTVSSIAVMYSDEQIRREQFAST